MPFTSRILSSDHINKKVYGYQMIKLIIHTSGHYINYIFIICINKYIYEVPIRLLNIALLK